MTRRPGKSLILMTGLFTGIAGCGGSSGGGSPDSGSASPSSDTAAFAAAFGAACSRATAEFPTEEPHTVKQFVRAQRQFFRGDAMLTRSIRDLGETSAQQAFVRQLIAGHEQIVGLHQRAISVARKHGLAAADQFLQNHPGALHVSDAYASVRQEATDWGLNQNCI